MGRLLIIFLAVIAILIIIQAIFGVASATFWAINEFLFNTRWGLIAFIFLGLAAFFFYASSKTYPQVREKGRVIDTVKPFLQNIERGFSNTNKEIKMPKPKKPTSSLSVYGKNENEINLSNLNLQGVVRNLAIAINKPNPVFFKGWGNRRLELDVERVYIIKDYIEAIRSAGESFINLQADSILSYEKIEKLVQINRNVLLKQLRESELEIDILETEYQARADRLRIDIKNLEAILFEKLAEIENLDAQTKNIISDIENTKKQVETNIKVMLAQTESNIKVMEDESKARIELNQDKANAEIYVMKLQAKDHSRISKLKEKILNRIIAEMNLDNINPAQVYMLIELLEPNNRDTYFDFSSRAEIVKEEIERMRIGNLKSKAEVREANAKADEIVAQSKQNIKDLYK